TDAQGVHRLVMQDGAAVTDAAAKPHDGVAMDAGHALNSADRHALGEGCNDFNLLVAGKDVHGPNPQMRDGPTRDSGKTAWNPLYVPDRSFASGPNPGVDDRDRQGCNRAGPTNLVQGVGFGP